MTARPIIFSAPMICALLAGDKTQTRRIVKPQPPRDHSPLVVERFYPTVIDRYGDEQPGDEVFGVTTENGEWCTRCPHGQPGDTLWVREAIFVQPDLWSVDHGPQPVHYAADIGHRQEVEDYVRKPSIHMPRWASRLTLRITDVRVQRLQEISEGDARAEGCHDRPFPGPWWQGYCDINGELHHQQAIGDQPPDWMIEPKRMADTPHLDLTAVDDFRSVWLSIHGPDSWSANPWVWALTFEVIRKNVDEVRE